MLANLAHLALTRLLVPPLAVHVREGNTTTRIPRVAWTVSLRSTPPLEFSLCALIATELASTVVLERHFV